MGTQSRLDIWTCLHESTSSYLTVTHGSACLNIDGDCLSLRRSRKAMIRVNTTTTRNDVVAACSIRDLQLVLCIVATQPSTVSTVLYMYYLLLATTRPILLLLAS
jgi:hypothetical protein